MKGIKWRYTRAYNKRYKRRGTLWQERFKSLVIEDERYLYACGLYIEANPVKAGLVAKSEEWDYRSARCYFSGQKDTLVDFYEPPSLPEDISFDEDGFFTKGEGIGSDLFRIHQREDRELWLPVP